MNLIKTVYIYTRYTTTKFFYTVLYMRVKMSNLRIIAIAIAQLPGTSAVLWAGFS
jgi:hypothetical protein